MKKVIFIQIAVILTIGSLFGQEKTRKELPAQISFVYPLGTSGKNSIYHHYNFSLNMLLGSVGSIEGCEVGGLINSNRSYVKGFQMAGLGNITKGDVKGMQAAGLMNISNNMEGFQAGGLFNAANAKVNGMQVGGLFNSSKDIEGYQTSGLFNSAENATGLQTAGIFNTSNSVNGVQIGGILNINSEDLKGVQIAGIYNQTKKLNGFQLGLINIIDTVESGISVGLITIIRKGYYDELEISVSDYNNIAFAYKGGLKSFYNIVSVSYNFIEDELLGIGFGFGLIKEIDSKHSFQPELIWNTYLPTDFKNIRTTHIINLKFGMVRNINKKLALSFSPGIYVGFKNLKDGKYGYTQSPIKPVYWHNGEKSRTELGVGFSLGLSFI